MTKCKVCGKSINYRNSFIHHSTYCSKTCKWSDDDWKNKCKEKTITEETLIKREQTCLKKYGVENVSQLNEIKEKKIKTTLSHYGVEHHMQNLEIFNKSKQTCLEKYGVEHVSQISEIKERKRYKQAIVNYQELSKYRDYVLPNFGFSEYLKNGLNNQSWICVKCGKVFTQEFHYTTGHIKNLQTCPRCLNCYPLNQPVSNKEKELVNFCKQFYPNLIENDRELIKPKELDIVIPELKLAIEFNGDYWHSMQAR